MGLSADQYKTLTEQWEAGEHTTDAGVGSRRGVQEQWVQHIKPDGSLEDVGPGMTPSEGSVPIDELGAAFGASRQPVEPPQHL